MAACCALVLETACRPRAPRRPLQDTDPVFVIPAIKQTGEANRTANIPRLIELLDSEDSAVRLASIQALRDLTGEDFGYEVWHDADGRSESVSQWKRWAAENGYGVKPQP